MTLTFLHSRFETQIRYCAFFAVLFLVQVVFNSSVRAQSREYEIKSFFLYNFIRFTTWPDSLFDPSENTFSVCIYGEDPFGSILEKTLLSKRAVGHPIRIERFSKRDQIKRCNILFISAAESDHYADILSLPEVQHSLTVSENVLFAKEGGIINFRVINDKVKFEINLSAARRARLKISSQLLRLALTVYDASG